MSLDFLDINDVYILDETGEEVNKVTGLYTKDENATATEQSQARANIMAGGSNRNLLDNPWFTVRQRGNGPFTSGYTVDRWKVSGGTPTITPRSPYGINIRASSAFAFDEFMGMDSAALLGKTVTLSVLIGGVVYSGTATYTSSTSIIINVQAGGIYVRLVYDANHPQIRIYGEGTNNVDIDAVKLELGSVSTLANDAPPNYAEELAKCQYYCRVIQGKSFIAVGQAVATTVIRFPLPYVMRERPTATLTGTAQVYGKGGPLTPSALSCTGNTTQCIEISTNVSGATLGQSYILVFSGANDKIVISADL